MLSVSDLSVEALNEIFAYLDFDKKIDGTLVNLFLENSTRTQISFEKAGLDLGLKVINFNTATSSLNKSESMQSTLLTLDSYEPDIIAMRTKYSHLPHELSAITNAKIINAGDGANEHPTQALGDLLTIITHFKIQTPLTNVSLKGLEVSICGDILHSRVACSNLILLSKLGCTVNLVSTPNLLPKFLADYFVQNFSCKIHFNIANVLETSDVIMLLRYQTERGASPTSFISLNKVMAGKMQGNAIVLHPGPMNEGVEIDYNTAYQNPKSQIFMQSHNCYKIRRAILAYLLLQK
jgi:aspartate carbamoyltransferase catalytic subunit